MVDLMAAIKIAGFLITLGMLVATGAYGFATLKSRIGSLERGQEMLREKQEKDVEGINDCLTKFVGKMEKALFKPNGELNFVLATTCEKNREIEHENVKGIEKKIDGVIECIHKIEIYIAGAD